MSIKGSRNWEKARIKIAKEIMNVLKVTTQEPVPGPVKAGEVPMQPTGAPLALAILSVLMTVGGLLTPKIK